MSERWGGGGEKEEIIVRRDREWAREKGDRERERKKREKQHEVLGLATFCMYIRYVRRRLGNAAASDNMKYGAPPSTAARPVWNGEESLICIFSPFNSFFLSGSLSVLSCRSLSPSDSPVLFVCPVQLHQFDNNMIKAGMPRTRQSLWAAAAPAPPPLRHPNNLPHSSTISLPFDIFLMHNLAYYSTVRLVHALRYVSSKSYLTFLSD